jgi:hypothetical protein
MRKCPFAVAVISWLFIAMGVVMLALDVRHLTARPFHQEDIWIALVHILAIVDGAFMLRGDNWARWLALL